MKKLNQAWVFSDGIKGHELQSRALASSICDNVKLFHCGIRQPWLSFAPRLLTGFGRNIIWADSNKPSDFNLPDVIITTGRRMAAVGKFFKRKYKLKHVQILNPKDNLRNYDVLVSPAHDGLQAANVVNIKGGLHQFDAKRLRDFKHLWQAKINPNNEKVLSLFIGNPIRLLDELNQLESYLAKNYAGYLLHICGSRRTSSSYKKAISETLAQAQSVWFSESDGENPYLGLLSCSDVFMVTADSINMITETCATNKPVVVIADKYVSPKHKRFVASLDDRVSFVNQAINKSPLAMFCLPEASNRVLEILSQ